LNSLYQSDINHTPI